MNELALFAGAGGGLLGSSQLGWRTRCAVEIDPYARKCLLARQRDGCLERFPIWDDVRTFDGNQWRDSIDIITGGFPCQDISRAGKGAGIDGDRSGLWREMARIICEVRPKFVFVENSPMLTSRGLGTVLADLAKMGFDAQWGVLGAADVGASHQRDRIWIVAKVADSTQLQRNGSDDNSQKRLGFKSLSKSGNNNWPENVANSAEIGSSIQKTGKKLAWRYRSTISCLENGWWRREPRQVSRTIKRGLGGMADGLANRMDGYQSNQNGANNALENSLRNRVNRLQAIGNGQVPATMMLAWKILTKDL